MILDINRILLRELGVIKDGVHECTPTPVSERHVAMLPFLGISDMHQSEENLVLTRPQRISMEPCLYMVSNHANIDTDSQGRALRGKRRVSGSNAGQVEITDKVQRQT